MKNEKRTLIAVLSKYPSKSTFASRDSGGLDITIMRLDDKGQGPRNWSYSDYSEDTNALFGGFKFHVWMHNDSADNNKFYCRQEADTVQGNSAAEYTHSAKGLTKLAKLQADQYSSRGNALDVADELGRWLEAMGIKTVLTRPTGEHDNGWLTHGSWDHWSPGRTINALRSVIAEWQSPALNAATA